MTVPLSAESPRREAARRFGLLMRKTMAKRKVGTHPLAAATGCATSAIACWRGGQNLPRLETALRVAEALEEPRLAQIVRECRTGTCEGCGRSFLNEGGKPRRFCRDDCRDASYRNRNANSGVKARATALDLLRAELLRTGPVRKQAVGKALTLLTDEEERSPGLVARRRMPVFQAAIEAMCRACEPEGFCRDAACPLRPVSPLLIRDKLLGVELAKTPEGRWGPTHRDERLATWNAALARRWDRPGEREKHVARMKARHAAMTPDQRTEQVQRLVAGQGRMKRRAATEVEA